jgi:hypothetical protein
MARAVCGWVLSCSKQLLASALLSTFLNSLVQFLQRFTVSSSIGGVSSRQKIDEKWSLPIPEDDCCDFFV